MVSTRKANAAKRNAASDAVGNTVDKSEKQEPLVGNLGSKASVDYQSLDKKLDLVVQYVEEIKSMGTKRPFLNEDEALPLDTFSSCLESLKMVESLKKQNFELSKKLESTNGKLQVYEEMKATFDCMKEMTVLSNITKVTGVFVKYASQLRNDISALPVATDVEPNATTRDGTNSDVANDELKYAAEIRGEEGTNSDVANDEFKYAAEEIRGGEGTNSDVAKYAAETRGEEGTNSDVAKYAAETRGEEGTNSDVAKYAEEIRGEEGTIVAE